MKKLMTITLVAVFALSSCQKEGSAESPDFLEIPSHQEMSAQYIEGVANVQFTEEMAAAVASAIESGSFVGTKASGFADLKQSLGIVSITRKFPDAGEYEARHRAAGLHRWYVVNYSREVAHTKAEADLALIDGVEYVGTPIEKRANKFDYFNDPYAYYQWHYYNDGSLSSGFKNGIDINVVPVWKEYTTGSSNVIVGVVDTGVQMDHVDLADNTLPEISRSFVYGHEGPEIYDEESHGTHVSGTIAAVNNNDIGVCGIAGGDKMNGKSGVKIMNCQIFRKENGNITGGDSEAAIVWAADHGAVILNNSWGLVFDDDASAVRAMESFESGTYAKELKDAIDYFIQYAGYGLDGEQNGPMAGGLVLFSAGNDSFTGSVPAGYSKVVAVGAFGPTGKSAYYTNYGTWVDIAAPGGDADVNSSYGLVTSTFLNNDYGMYQGTSMACPHVAGVAALLVSYLQGPGLTPDRIRELLILGAKKGVLNEGKVAIGPKLDAYGSFLALNTDKPTLESDNKGDIELKSHESKTVNYTIGYNADGKFAVDFESSDKRVTAKVTNTKVTVSLDALLFGKEASGYFIVTVAKGMPSFQLSDTVKFTILPNHAPVLTKNFDDMVLNGEKGSTVTFNLNEHFIDPDGEVLSFDTKVGSNALSAKVSDGIMTLTSFDYGTSFVTVTASDARSEKVESTFNVMLHNPANDIDIYPNPVNRILYVRPAVAGRATVTISNQFGSVVYSGENDCGPFAPYSINVEKFEAGSYTVKAEFSGRSVSTKIMKY